MQANKRTGTLVLIEGTDGSGRGCSDTEFTRKRDGQAYQWLDQSCPLSVIHDSDHPWEFCTHRQQRLQLLLWRGPVGAAMCTKPVVLRFRCRVCPVPLSRLETFCEFMCHCLGWKLFVRVV